MGRHHRACCREGAQTRSATSPAQLPHHLHLRRQHLRYLCLSRHRRLLLQIPSHPRRHRFHYPQLLLPSQTHRRLPHQFPLLSQTHYRLRHQFLLPSRTQRRLPHQLRLLRPSHQIRRSPNLLRNRCRSPHPIRSPFLVRLPNPNHHRCLPKGCRSDSLCQPRRQSQRPRHPCLPHQELRSCRHRPRRNRDLFLRLLHRRRCGHFLQQESFGAACWDPQKSP